MQAHYPFEFEREMGCTIEEFKAGLPGACGGRTIEWREAPSAALKVGAGTCVFSWRALPDRRIALLSLPRLCVHTKAHLIEHDLWQDFMRYFDLYMQRGGG